MWTRRKRNQPSVLLTAVTTTLKQQNLQPRKSLFLIWPSETRQATYISHDSSISVLQGDFVSALLTLRLKGGAFEQKRPFLSRPGSLSLEMRSSQSHLSSADWEGGCLLHLRNREVLHGSIQQRETGGSPKSVKWVHTRLSQHLSRYAEANVSSLDQRLLDADIRNLEKFCKIISYIYEK